MKQSVNPVLPNDQPPFDPLQLLAYAIHYRWLIVGFALLGIGAGLVKTYSQTPMYRATAKLEIQAASPRVYEELQVYSENDQGYALENAIIRFKSGEVARRIVRDLKLDEENGFLAPAPRGSIAGLIARARGGDGEGGLDGWTQQQREATAVGIVLGGLSVTAIPETSVISVSFSHAAPQYTAIVANQAMRSFIDHTIDKTQPDFGPCPAVPQGAGGRDQGEAAAIGEGAGRLRAGAGHYRHRGRCLADQREHLAASTTALAQAIQERLATERDLEQVDAGRRRRRCRWSMTASRSRTRGTRLPS